MDRVQLHVNSICHDFDISGEVNLLDFLREHLGLTGAKKGCGTGECGSCTVLIDGQPKNSCHLQLKDVAGKRITTIEGLCDPLVEKIRQSFLAVSAPQCGFCTPAMVIRAYALLKKNSSPHRSEIEKALAPTLCRCTGYKQYCDGVLLAADLVSRDELNADMVIESRFMATERGDCCHIGVSSPKIDGVALLSGSAKFADDFRMDDMLHGALVLSPYPSADIEAIDFSHVLAMDGVVQVITANDIEGRNNYGKVVRDREALCSQQVRCVGDPLVLVLAESESSAHAAAAAVNVRYVPREPVLSAKAALLESSPKVHETGNVLNHIVISRGEPEEFFSDKYAVFEGSYETSRVDQCPLELASSLAYYDDQGLLTVVAPTQNVFFDRLNISRVLGLKADDVRVFQPAVGGAFGKREDIHTQIFAALGTLKTKRAVKVRLDRRESFLLTTKRHPFEITLRTAVDRSSGKIVAQKVVILADGGAYSSWSINILRKAAVHCCGPYEIPHVMIDAKVVYTNNPPSGAMRGFGVPQVAFAMESHLDMIAFQLKRDSLELRTINMLRKGSHTITGQLIEYDAAGLDTVKSVKKKWPAILGRLPAENKNLLYGSGFASCLYGIGFGAGIKDVGKAIITLENNGTFNLKTGVVDYGQGASTVLRQLAAEALGIEPDYISLVSPDTHKTPNSGSSVASRQTFITGNAVVQAAENLKERLFEMAAKYLDVEKNTLFFSTGELVSPTNLTRMALPELYTIARRRSIDMQGVGEFRGHVFTSRLTSDSGQGNAYYPFTFGTQCARVSVDPQSGKVSVLSMLAVHYIGKALNPQQVKGQILGAISMGIGFALYEKISVSNGDIQASRLSDYRLIRSNEMPPTSIILLEDNEIRGPYGAVGIGEPPIVPTAPAITNAIFNATGYRVTQLPVEPEKILTALREK